MVQSREKTSAQYTAHMYVNGRDLDTDATVPVINPARLDEVVGTIPRGSVEQVQLAIQAAHSAFPAWSALSMTERAAMLARALEAAMPGMEDRAALLTRENGKTLYEARFDVLGAKRCVDFYVDAAQTFELESSLPSPSGRVSVVRQPMGVASIIVPWNGPVILAFLGIAPALVAGNTVVLKPSTFVPLALIDTVRQMAAELPPGVLNVVVGEGTTVGKELVTHPLVRRVIFTGSSDTGKQILQWAGGSVKRCTMELGGNDPAIVRADADFAVTIPGLIKAALGMSGQICYAAKRIYVDHQIYDQFADEFTEAVDEVVVGNGLDPKVTMGSMTTRSQYDFVNELIAEIRTSDATIKEVGKRAVSPEEWKNGLFIAPHVVTDVDQKARVVSCEQFGPVIPILPYRTEDEAVQLANDTEYGLASSIWTRDLDRGWELAKRINAGSTFINAHSGASGVDMPFGGFGCSGLGRGHGVVALEEQFELHTLSTRGGGK